MPNPTLPLTPITREAIAADAERWRFVREHEVEIEQRGAAQWIVRLLVGRHLRAFHGPDLETAVDKARAYVLRPVTPR